MEFVKLLETAEWTLILVIISMLGGLLAFLYTVIFNRGQQQGDISRLQEDVKEIRKDVKSLTHEIKDDIKGRLIKLEGGFAGLKSSFKLLESSFKTLESSFRTLESSVKADIKELTHELRGSMNDRITKLESHFDAHTTDDEIIQAESPRVLNDVGVKVAAQINAEKFAEKYMEKLEIAENMSEFEIQNTCSDYARTNLINELTSEEKAIVQKSAYDNGISLNGTLAVIGVKMRDSILKAHGFDVPCKNERVRLT